MLALCLLHGGTFLGIRSTGVVVARAAVLARRLAIPAAALVLAFVVWTYALARPGVFADDRARRAAARRCWSRSCGAARPARRRAFAAHRCRRSAACSRRCSPTLYPTLLISTTEPAFSLTVENAAASSYSLQVMTIVAAVLVPLVLAYQGWTYWVFRARLAAPPGEPTTVLPQRH